MPSPNGPDDGPEANASRYVTTFDPEAGERASDAIVTAVAAIVGTDSVDLPPLYDAVDPEALDSLVEHAQRMEDAGTHQVWFTYESFDVGVRTDGEIRIRDATTAS
ncbi:HalOD1 output domain-containing protein [Natrinema longum]|uniref:Halobacterial output domain-containing protein n=1 Tax=Natrinema longum TaxID=370324 RepID=A0A8A2UDH5_9EURY|nr:HalOD1 output domain-containing protein [Natrinema longum]MBZ6495330.1 hypothetical protein [Natrinema longum]QSW86697.1 hypothetical protein J0X27_07760 [Natrinema longum]